MSKMSEIKLSRRRMIATMAATAASPLFARSSSAKELTKASLRLKWLASAQFVGYYVAKDKGWYAEEGLDLTINPGGPNIIGENMVASGSDTFGHAGGAASLLQARSKQMPIVGIGMLFQETPYRFIALPKSGIKKFSDVKGKTISTWFTGPQFILQGVLKSQGIPLDSVHIQAQAASMVPFTEGKVDVATATLYDELPVLKREGITDLVVFNPAQMGVNLPNESIIVNEKTVKENPKLVQGFLTASLRGWVYALEHRKEAIDILMKSLPGGNRVHQEDELAQIPALLLYGDGRTKGIGYIDMKALEFTNKFLVDNGVIKQAVDVEKAVDRTFWEHVPDKDKKVAG
ncbi:MAG TPA: ABC transporter substrate-binding protein [Alphaproteobacteria bacterium]|nr:ABC transporter substrate-binding protein [Alphaproteobacteria bacterium]